MKLLFVHPSVELYGADKIMLYMLKMLNAKHEITVLLPKDGVLVEYIKAISTKIEIKIFAKLPIVHSKLKLLDYVKLPSKIFQCRRLFSGKKFDYCFCNTLATVLLLFAHFSRKRVLYVHEIISNTFLNFGFSFLAKTGANEVVCVSEHVKQNLFFSGKYPVVHNGIPDIAAVFLENKINSDGKIRFVLPGRFMPQKGQWFLLSALHKLPEEYKRKIHIDLFGSAPPFKPELYARLQDDVKSKNLIGLVSVHDFSQNIDEMYKSANVVLVPSLMSDPFPTTVLEAMMFSRPVITTDNGGAVEILDETFSRTIKPNDDMSFVTAIEFFVDNVNLLADYSKLARNAFCSYLTLEHYEKRFFDLFGELR
ncbi:MAG: glycosyltransferase family 4 protein [Treponema sp.]|nr:glycosyltransferase family 4 protein [Treponema sp.]